MNHILAIILILFSLEVYAESFTYSLQYGNENPICVDINNVLNSKFKKPWDNVYIDSQGSCKNEDINPEDTARALNKVDIYKEADWDPLVLQYLDDNLLKKFARNQLVNWFPKANEFEKINWKIFRACSGNESGISCQVLAAHVDVDNDGILEWVVKPVSIYFAVDNDKISVCGRDILKIYSGDNFKFGTAIDLNNPAPFEVTLSENINGSFSGLFHRPFIYRNQFYLLEHYYLIDNSILNKRYFNVVKINSLKKPTELQDVRTEMVCSIKMQNSKE